MLTRELVDAYVDRCLDAESAPRAAELARELSVSRDTLNRWAKDVLGVPVGEYLRARQVDRARRLLEQTTLTATKIAYRTGFGTRRALFRAFARATSMTPGAYRSRLTK
ncbi:MAG TPA: helix-turn-helix domain-containing protein [Thermoanaerobaculia bacterium]